MNFSRGSSASLYCLLASYVSGLLLFQAGPFAFFGACLLFCLSVFAFHSIEIRKGIFLCAAMFLVAGARVALETPHWNARHQVNGAPEGFFRVRLEENLRERPRTWRAVASVEAAWEDSLWVERAGKVQVYFPKLPDSLPAEGVLPVCGERVLLRGRMLPVEGFVGEDGVYFDYAAFLAKRGIHAQCFLRQGDWRILPGQGGSGMAAWLKGKMARLRLSLEDFLDESGMDRREAEVGKALILGGRVEDEIVQEAYRDTGIVHVLAVSGMHLSIFAIVAASLFSFMGKRGWRKWLKFLAVVSLVWAYALLTGMAASVARAACMFTFVGIGKCLGRDVRTERSLAVSALFLLFVNPFFLYDLGFLLSYAAVAGLVFLSPVFSAGFVPARRLAAGAWNLAVSSCAAQVATLPVILHCFGTFPTYFLIANLLVTPLVNMALPLGLVAVAVSCFWEGGGLALAWVLDWLLKGMNGLALWIGAWPSALLELPLSLFSAVAFCVFLVFFYRGFSYRDKKALQAGLGLLIVVLWAG